MEQKSIRIYRNPEKGGQIIVCWKNGENIDENTETAAIALGCSSEWLENRIDEAYMPNIGISEVDLYREKGQWNANDITQPLQVGGRVNLTGEIISIDGKTGEVTLLLDGVPMPISRIDPRLLTGLKLPDAD